VREGKRNRQREEHRRREKRGEREEERRKRGCETDQYIAGTLAPKRLITKRTDKTNPNLLGKMIHTYSTAQETQHSTREEREHRRGERR
jgi:hypothetical protein